MGRVFLIEKDGPVCTCATCNVQIARSGDLFASWLNFYQFYLVYNVMVADVPVLYHHDLFSGHEVSCVNCRALLGWRDTKPPDQSPEEEFTPAFVFKHGRIAPPPPPPDNLPQD